MVFVFTLVGTGNRETFSPNDSQGRILLESAGQKWELWAECYV